MFPQWQVVEEAGAPATTQSSCLLLKCLRISPEAGLSTSSSWCIQNPVSLHDTVGLSNLEKITWIKLR
ncbi:hypothetical protein E2C01_030095 [Portunus trituberculatus]|uniref:Uncharacterized protein n=1 Tax=Portunus trituberculatus TaxID=210409 RepID=A0A5B7EUA5_PORTR|nr:hypothetical protein [Portunus trituberculatus]